MIDPALLSNSTPWNIDGYYMLSHGLYGMFTRKYGAWLLLLFTFGWIIVHSLRECIIETLRKQREIDDFDNHFDELDSF